MNEIETPRTFLIRRNYTEYENGRYKATIIDVFIHADQLERELTAVTEQRDRLAEALRKAILWGESASHRIFDRENINWTYLNEAREALQSLTPNAEP